MDLQALKEAVLAQRQFNETADTDLEADLETMAADSTVSFKGPNAVTDLLDWLNQGAE